MRFDVVPARSFDGSSRASAYWLANCVGFRVRHGRRRGVVRDVVLDPATGHAEHLVVRFGLRRIGVDVRDVDSVIPARELLVLRPRQRTAPRVAPAARRARDTGARASRHARHAGARASRNARDAGARAALAGGRATRRASAATAHGAALAAARSARETQTFVAWATPRAVAAGQAFARAVAVGTVLVAVGVAATGRVLRRLAAAVTVRIREARAPRAADDGSPYTRAGTDASSSSTSSHSTAV